MNLNKAIIVGRITNNPELKAMPSGSHVCAFSVATNEVYKDKSGQKQEKAEFHNIVCFGATAENVAKYMSKGNEIMIEGKIQTRSWDDKDGMKRYRTEIIAQHVQFGAKSQGSNTSHQSGQSDVQNSNERPNDDIEFPDDDINPEDIPF